VQQKIPTASYLVSIYLFNNKKIRKYGVYDGKVELAVSIITLPNVCPPSLLILIIGWIGDF
jgi:hypothetical protein